MTEGNGEPKIVSAVKQQIAANDLSDFYTLTDEKFPGKVPIFNWCHRCGADLSQVCSSFLITVASVREGQPRMVKGQLRGSQEVQLTQQQQFVTVTPQRCPHCHWPLWWGPPQNVTAPPISDEALGKKMMEKMEKKDA